MECLPAFTHSPPELGLEYFACSVIGHLQVLPGVRAGIIIQAEKLTWAQVMTLGK